MEQAIEWAAGCKPTEARIPKVGAIVAIDNVIIGRGRRGTGKDGDDDHAEHVALDEVRDKASLPRATLYTTLEPCTPEVRTKSQECCTEIILRHEINRVFIGILDPNQGVTGKGIWKLQSSGIDVHLYPHALAQRIRSINAEFISCQQSLGAKIIDPENGATLHTTKTNGRHPVRVRCLNPPTASNYLFVSRNGLYWPMPGPFRSVGRKEWEIDASFGSIGEHSLHIVTAAELGQVLIDYYRMVVRWNLDRRERIKTKYSPSDEELKKLLGGDYFGISMTALRKGLHSEASIQVTTA